MKNFIKDPKTIDAMLLAAANEGVDFAKKKFGATFGTLTSQILINGVSTLKLVAVGGDVSEDYDSEYIDDDEEKKESHTTLILLVRFFNR